MARVCATTSPAPMMLPRSSTGCTVGRNTTPEVVSFFPGTGLAVTSISMNASGLSSAFTGTV
jgi:hypothetical protein